MAASRPPLHLRAMRELFDRKLERELAAARSAGVDVLVLRPNARQAGVQGLNLMRQDGHSEVAELAYLDTASTLRTEAGRPHPPCNQQSLRNKRCLSYRTSYRNSCKSSCATFAL